MSLSTSRVLLAHAGLLLTQLVLAIYYPLMPVVLSRANEYSFIWMQNVWLLLSVLVVAAVEPPYAAAKFMSPLRLTRREWLACLLFAINQCTTPISVRLVGSVLSQLVMSLYPVASYIISRCLGWEPSNDWYKIAAICVSIGGFIMCLFGSGSQGIVDPGTSSGSIAAGIVVATIGMFALATLGFLMLGREAEEQGRPRRVILLLGCILTFVVAASVDAGTSASGSIGSIGALTIQDVFIFLLGGLFVYAGSWPIYLWSAAQVSPSVAPIYMCIQPLLALATDAVKQHVTGAAYVSPSGVFIGGCFVITAGVSSIIVRQIRKAARADADAAIANAIRAST